MKIIVNGTTITEEEYRVVERMMAECGANTAIVSPDDDPQFYRVEFRKRAEKFERIRRITGYLVGTLDKWNDGKRAEERDRVKHGGI